MAHPSQQLLDMAAVHGFYVSLLKENLGFDIPVPTEIQASLGDEEKFPALVDLLGRWLALLDLAVAPVMVRDGLRDTVQNESADALLRYCRRKASALESDRDKADFVVTYLFRLSGLPLRSLEEWETEVPSAFEQQLYKVLGMEEVEPLPQDCRNLVLEFPFIRQEVEGIRHFDNLMDSGVMQRVREIKQRFGTWFYHPRVLATIAEYNVFMGDRFDELFRDATRSIKQFATCAQEAGGSIMARVEGDVTVQQLAEVQEEKILGAEYGKAQEHLRTISKFKKAVDRRTGIKPVPAATVPPSAPGGIAPLARGASPYRPLTPADHNADRRAGENYRAMVETIRNFILATPGKSASVFPLRSGNLALSPIEVEAFRSDFRGEKSFRGDFTRAITEAVAVQACMIGELDEFRRRQESAYLWKPYADALSFLVQTATQLQQNCAAILQVAKARGLADKVDGLSATLQRLRAQSEAVRKELGNASPKGTQ
jgi:hypothetical protein